MTEYDEDRELTRYVWASFGYLLTPFERRVGLAADAAVKAAASHSAVARLITTRYGLVGDPQVDAALADGVEAFLHRVRDRVLATHGAEIFVNRCPACGRVVRTPQARQCFWCGHDWHERSAQGEGR